MFNSQIKAAAISEGEFKSVELDDGSGVVITLVDGQLVAFSARCPHAAGDFREGEIHRGRAFCPVHQWKFDIKSGRCVGDENYRLKKYGVQVLDGMIYLEIYKQ